MISNSNTGKLLFYPQFQMLTCGICNHRSSTLRSYMLHYKLHSNSCYQDFPCGIENCPLRFKTYNSFQIHVTRAHQNIRRNIKVGLHGQRLQGDVNLTCTVATCEQICNDPHEIVSHYRTHISQGLTISCPFQGCSKAYNVDVSFRSHISRQHRRHLTVSNQNASDRANVQNEVDESEDTTNSADTDDFMPEPPDDYNENETVEDNIDDDAYLLNVALFYLRMETKYHVPASTVQTIVEELRNLYELDRNHEQHLLKQKLTSEELSLETINGIISEIQQGNLFTKAHNEETGELRTSFTRKEFFKEKLNYVEPVKIRLGADDNGCAKFCHYVPIKESLKAMLKHPSVLHQYKNPYPATESPELYTDFSDGSIYKDIQIFNRLQHCAKLILYQDSFEVVNPLGSSKKKHKIVGVYYTLGNLYPFNRSKIDPIQLICLCKEVDYVKFGSNVVFRKLVDDLKELEENGIDIGETEPLHAVVFAILGDNLGSHEIGGFTCNFSTTQYMCRYCLIHRDILWEQGSDDNVEFRTVNNYRGALNELALDESLAHFEGVKADSVFNQLKYFHVCQRLPPCLGHDLFEGVVKYDLALAFRYFVREKKWFTFHDVNTLLNRFQLHGTDALDKPNSISDGSSIGRNAVQVWCFLRILPLLVGTRIQNVDDPVWELVLTLREIVELTCSPAITLQQVAYLEDLIRGYLSAHKASFDKNFRPKHHYLSHYPKLIMMLGPLIRLWTMRMES